MIRAKDLIAQLQKVDPEKQVDAVIEFDDGSEWVGGPTEVEDDEVFSAAILHIRAGQKAVPAHKPDNAINRNDLLAYLYVLNYKPVLFRMPSIQEMGRPNVIGCLQRLLDQLEEHNGLRYLYELVRSRELWNGKEDKSVELEVATAHCAEALYQFYMSANWRYEDPGAM